MVVFVVLLGLLLAIAYMTSYESGGVPLGCGLFLVVLILGAVILTGTR
jgi:hypothetical protein